MAGVPTEPATWLLLLPEILILAAALVVPFVGARPGSRIRSRLTTTTFALAFLTILWMMGQGALGFFNRFPDLEADPVIFGVYEVTPFALFFKLVFLVVALLVSTVSRDYLDERRETAEYYSLLLISTLGMMAVASARDLLTLFVALETSAISTFILAGFQRRREGNAEAAVKIFIIGALSAALLLYGISLVYAAAGTLDLYEIGAALQDPGDMRPALIAALAFLIAGFAFEITAVPFHMWAPDVYDGAPDPVSGLISGAAKKMGFAAFFKVFFVALLAVRLQWEVLVGILAVLTMTVANLAALRQTRLKRLLAWSSIAQAGYIMIAIPVGTELALTGSLFHILTHAIMKGGAFVLVAVVAARGIGDRIEDWASFHKRDPILAFTFTLLLLSMAGIPPLAGFASKFVLFGGVMAAGVATDNGWLTFLVVAAIANSALSLFYYVRVIRALYVDEAETAPPRLVMPLPGAVATAVLLVLVVLIGIWPQPFIELSRAAAQSLLAP